MSRKFFDAILLLLMCLFCTLPLQAQVEQAAASPAPSIAQTTVSPGEVTPPAPASGLLTPEPATTSPPPTVTTPLPVEETPVAGTPGKSPVSISADVNHFSPDVGLYQFIGNVELRTSRVQINADEVSYNANTNSAQARGNVSIQAPDGNIYKSDLLDYNFTTGNVEIQQVSTIYPARFLGPPFLAPLYLQSKDITGTFRSGAKQQVHATNSVATTCDLAHPHYYLRSRRVDIYPGDKLIAYDNDLFILDQRVFYFPWIFISLRNYHSSIVPQVGQNNTEGFYARFLYQYVLNPSQLGGIRFDITQKLGLGLGIDHFYKLGNGSGEAFLYARQGMQERVLRLDHTQQLPGQVGFTLRFDNRKNSLFSLQPTTLTDVTTVLTRQTEHTNASFNFTRRLNEGQFGTDNLTANLQYTSSVAAGNLSTSVDYSSYGLTGSLASAKTNNELWSRIAWRHPLGFSDLNFQMNKRFEFGAEDANSGLQRLPEITLQSASRGRQFSLLKGTNSTYTLGWGFFDETGGISNGKLIQQQLDRYQLDLGTSILPMKFGGTTLSGTTRYRQTVYGDKDTTALYMYNVNLAATSTFGSFANSFSYGKQESRGFTPFRFDVVYPYNSLYNTLSYRSGDGNVRLFLRNGRDIQNHRWQDISFNGDAQLTRTLSTQHSLAYDLNTKRWRNLTSNFSWTFAPAGQVLNIGTLYDFNIGQLRRVSTQLRWEITSKWQLQWLGGYDGVLKQFSYNEFLLKRDLHCWDVAVYYSRDQQSFGLFVRLKALNTPLPDFQIGRGGQILDTNVGILP